VASQLISGQASRCLSNLAVARLLGCVTPCNSSNFCRLKPAVSDKELVRLLEGRRAEGYRTGPRSRIAVLQGS